jgi:hypothetical protein
MGLNNIHPDNQGPFGDRKEEFCFWLAGRRGIGVAKAI